MDSDVKQDAPEKRAQPESEELTSASETEAEKGEEKTTEPWASPEKELGVLAPVPFTFECGGKTLTLKPFTLKTLRSVITDVMKVLQALTENEEILQSFSEPKKVLDPQILIVINPVMDSFVAILAELLCVEPDWLEDNLGLPHIGPLVLAFVKQNHIGLLVENFQQAALEIQGLNLG